MMMMMMWLRGWRWLEPVIDIMPPITITSESESGDDVVERGKKRQNENVLRGFFFSRVTLLLKRVCEWARVREGERGSEREARGSSVCPPWTQFCDRLTGRADDGRTNLRRSRAETGNSEVNSWSTWLKPNNPDVVNVYFFLSRRSGWLKSRPSFPPAWYLGIAFLSACLLFGTAARL